MGGSSAPPLLPRPLIMLQKIRAQPTHPAGAIDSSDHVGRLVGKSQQPNIAQFTQRVPLALLTMSGVWRYFRTPRHRSVHPAGATGASDLVGHLEPLQKIRIGQVNVAADGTDLRNLPPPPAVPKLHVWLKTSEEDSNPLNAM